MAKDKVEVDALSAMGFSVGCQVMAMKEALSTQLGLSPGQLEAFNAAYDKTYHSEMEMLIEELEDEGPAVAEMLREMVSQNGSEPQDAREPEEASEPQEAGEPEPSSVEPDASWQERIEAACKRVVAERPCLLSRDLHERTITGRIAHYLQPLVSEGYFVDCEYNKLADTIGADTTKKLSENDKEFAVANIIIHDRKRGAAGNLAVIEARWTGDDSGIERAKTKIGLYVNEPKLAYKLGFLALLKKDSIKLELIAQR
jgi:hypothetical protein